MQRVLSSAALLFLMRCRMIIEKISLHYFRNYEELFLQPHEGINIFFGKNGSGKTNLLEAVHYCSLGKSHRISQDQNAVMIGKKGASCSLTIKGSSVKNEIEIRLQPGVETVKTVWINQKKIGRLSEMMGILRCVIFSPEDLNLIKEGPAVRRKFLDMMISQISRSYFIALQQYRIAYNQRNAILRQARLENRRPDSMIADFEKEMAEYGQAIYRERKKITDLISEKGNEIYRKISGRETENLSIAYHPSYSWDDETESMEKLLEKNRDDDLRQGTASVGPHRDDLLLSLNHKSMKLYASQGQMRTAALSLKLAQMNIFQNITGEYPVLLLDDVLSELDLDRRMNLLKMIEGVQTFITCSDEGDLADYHNYRTYQVQSVQEKGKMTMTKAGVKMKTPVLHEPDFS